MTPLLAKQVKASEILKAFEDNKDIEWQYKKEGSWKLAEKPFNLSFDFDNHNYRIAKERQSLRPMDTGDGGRRDCFIDSDGLHVGCTTISFERVREIAKACGEWQNGGNEGVKPRREAWVLLRKIFNNDDLGWAFPTKEKAEDGARSNADTTGMIHMREVLPGEEEI